MPEHGFGLAAARELAAYWRDGYDWRAAEATLNGFEQFVAPTACTSSPTATARRCCSCTAGRAASGSSTRILPLLREHARVIVPSLPGYGFSFTPGGERASIVDCADALHALMALARPRALPRGRRRLGREHRRPARPRLPGGRAGAAPLHDAAAPARDLAGVRVRSRARRSSTGSDEEGGYVHIQGTRPQTLAYGLQDSPVGLMSWIAEKFDRWTDARGVPDDDLLTTVMIYWVTGSIGSSFWPYWARRHGDWVLDDVAAAGGRIAAPLTYLDFPKEIIHVPRVGRRARLRHRALGDAGLRRALPSAGGDRRARRQPAALRQPMILRTFS